MKKIIFLIFCVFLATAHGKEQTQTICIFDPVGNSGDIVALFKDYQVNLPSWGNKVKLKAHTDEGIIVNELKSGACDGAVLTGLSARPFNKFAATVEAVGGTLGDDNMRQLLQVVLTMADKQANKYLKNSHYEVAAIIPAGAVYSFMRDKNHASINRQQGLKIAVLQGDEVSQSIVRSVGASTIMATTTSFAGQFNNGNVEIVYAPALAYEPLELYRGIGSKGGVLNLPLLQLTWQLIIRSDKFAPEFGKKTRAYAALNFDPAFDLVNNSRAKIKPNMWIQPSTEQIKEYENLLQKSRIRLGNEGIYDTTMLKIMRKMRCQASPTRAECSR